MAETIYQVRYYRPGEEIPDPRAGDIGLVRSPYWYSLGIRLGEGLSGDWGFNEYNHAWVTRHDDGTIVESLVGGPTEGHVSKYRGMPYAIVREPMTKEDLGRGEAFLQLVLDQSNDTGYDWAGIAGGLPMVLSGGHLTMASAGSNYICSAMAAEYKVRSVNAYFPDRHAIFQWPSSLARFYGVEDPEYG